MKLLFFATAVLVLAAGTEAARIRSNRRFKQLREQAGDDEVMKNTDVDLAEGKI